MASGKIQQLQNRLKTLNIFPVTLTKAIYDDNGNSLDALLQDAICAETSEEIPVDVEPRDADTLGGRYNAEDIDEISYNLVDNGKQFKFGYNTDSEEYGYYADNVFQPFKAESGGVAYIDFRVNYTSTIVYSQKAKDLISATIISGDSDAVRITAKKDIILNGLGFNMQFVAKGSVVTSAYYGTVGVTARCLIFS